MFIIKRNRQHGFSLIELLVGIVLAMIAVIVVMQVFQFNERRQRAGTGGDAAIMDGAIAITELQRDLRMSGMGMSNLAVLGCSLALPNGVTLPALAPVSINSSAVPAGDDNTDTLLILYGGGNGSPEGNRVQAHPSAKVYNMNTPSAFVAQDYVIASMTTQPTTCSLRLDQVSAVSGVNPGGTVTTTTGSTDLAEAMFDWGQTPHLVAYRVFSGRLQQCDFLQSDCRTAASAGWTDLQEGVVSLRAQYGRDTNASMDGQVDQYDQSTPTSNCGWARASAVRVALTVRNGQLDKETELTGSGAGQSPVPTWSGNADAAIDLSARTDWKHYRYRVFETVAPLRNIAWIGAKSECTNLVN